MKIKIDIKNIAAIQAQLNKANGRSTAHTFTSATEIIDRADNAERQLAELKLPKSARAGAWAFAESGAKLPNAYRYQRITGKIKMVRGSSAWFLLECTTSETWGKSTGGTFVSLTAAQDTAAVFTFRARYAKQ